MREIKFRAWHRQRGQMIAVQGIRYDEDEDRLEVQHPGDPVNGCIIAGDINMYELMEYTGLKDRNGLDVYEGDIVRRTWSHTKGGKPRTVIEQVEYDPGMARFRFRHNYSKPKGATGYTDLYGGHYVFPWEVIGNIYENPELLESQS